MPSIMPIPVRLITNQTISSCRNMLQAIGSGIRSRLRNSRNINSVTLNSITSDPVAQTSNRKFYVSNFTNVSKITKNNGIKNSEKINVSKDSKSNINDVVMKVGRSKFYAFQTSDDKIMQKNESDSNLISPDFYIPGYSEKLTNFVHKVTKLTNLDKPNESTVVEEVIEILDEIYDSSNDENPEAYFVLANAKLEDKIASFNQIFENVIKSGNFTFISQQTMSKLTTENEEKILSHPLFKNIDSNIPQSNLLPNSATSSDAIHSVPNTSRFTVFPVISTVTGTTETDTFTLDDIDNILGPIPTPEAKEGVRESSSLNIELMDSIQKYDSFYNSNGKKNSAKLMSDTIETNPDIRNISHKTPEGHFVKFEANPQKAPLAKNPEVQKFFEKEIFKNKQDVSHLYFSAKDKEFNSQNPLVSSSHYFKKNPSSKINTKSPVSKKITSLKIEKDSVSNNLKKSQIPLKATTVTQGITSSLINSQIIDKLHPMYSSMIKPIAPTPDNIIQKSSKELTGSENDSSEVKTKIILNNNDFLNSTFDNDETLNDVLYHEELNEYDELNDELKKLIPDEGKRNHIIQEIKEKAEDILSSHIDQKTKSLEIAMTTNDILTNIIKELKALKSSSSINKTSLLNSSPALIGSHASLNLNFPKLAVNALIADELTTSIMTNKEVKNNTFDTSEIQEFITNNLPLKMSDDEYKLKQGEMNLNQIDIFEKLENILIRLVSNKTATKIVDEIFTQANNEFEKFNIFEKSLAIRIRKNDLLEQRILEISPTALRKI
ncbi:hypothetical protein ACVBEF_20705 [Glaciimonas sp. GG7]